jgi:hypothetical protein
MSEVRSELVPLVEGATTRPRPSEVPDMGVRYSQGAVEPSLEGFAGQRIPSFTLLYEIPGCFPFASSTRYGRSTSGTCWLTAMGRPGSQHPDAARAGGAVRRGWCGAGGQGRPRPGEAA